MGAALLLIKTDFNLLVRAPRQNAGAANPFAPLNATPAGEMPPNPGVAAVKVLPVKFTVVLNRYTPKEGPPAPPPPDPPLPPLPPFPPLPPAPTSVVQVFPPTTPEPPD